jgi:hypothetical protein
MRPDLHNIRLLLLRLGLQCRQLVERLVKDNRLREPRLQHKGYAQSWAAQSHVLHQE